MKKSLHIILSVVLCLSLMLPGFATTVQAVDAVSDKNVSSTATIDQNFADNRVLVVLTREASMTFTTYTANSFASLGCVSVTDLSDATGAMVKAAMEQAMETFSSRGISDLPSTPVEHSETISNYRQVLCLELNEASKENVIETIKLLSERDDVLYAGPDYMMELRSDEPVSATEVVSEIDNYELAVVSSVTPNDPDYSQQWGAETISLPEAWGITTGSSNVTVGVIDTGIDGDHPDLINNVSVSLSRGFYNGYVESFSSVTDTDLIPERGHGTQVAGVIGAQGNNNIGVAGVCWDVTLVSLNVFGTSGVTYSSRVALAINYATSVGIDVLNFSAGWCTDDSYYATHYDLPLNTVIGNYTGVFVCAIDNSSTNYDEESIIDYPAYYRLYNMITVGAVMENNHIYGAYGSTIVSLFAPGYEIYTTKNGGGYDDTLGTSVAAPYVTGVIALMLSVNPDLSIEEIKGMILDNVDVVDSLSGCCVAGGIINARIAVYAASIT